MIPSISVEKLFDKKSTIPVVDVRTPAEFEMGHIPGAVNIPLFSNEERAKIGTAYKKEGKTRALLYGLDAVGSKLSSYVKSALKIAKESNEIIVHCWRGGMRSSSMGILFQTAGIKTFMVTGGYKAYRRYIRTKLETKANILILSGETGSGKTEILHELENLGEQIIDLEQLARHKGSAFGALGQLEQPTSEQFENNLYEKWLMLDLSKSIWLEDESFSIGKVFLPEPLWEQMRNTAVIKIEVEKEFRINRLLKEYGDFDKSLLLRSLDKIKKRFDGVLYKKALEAAEENNYREATALALAYYDKAYNHGLSKRDKDCVTTIKMQSGDAKQNANMVLQSVVKT